MKQQCLASVKVGKLGLFLYSYCEWWVERSYVSGKRIVDINFAFFGISWEA